MPRRLTFDDLWRIPQPHDPQLSPDGGSVAYVLRQADRETDDYMARVWTVEVASGRVRPLTDGPADGSPRWSPDGRLLAFVSRRAGDEHDQIWLLPREGSEPRRLTAQPLGVSSAPIWAPDGRSIAFLAAVAEELPDTAPRVCEELPFKRDGVGYLPPGFAVHLHVVPAGGGEPRQLTTDEHLPDSPAWSPDSESIAFTAEVAGRSPDPPSQVFVVPAAGGVARRVSDDDRLHSFVDWAPDGRSLITIAAAPGTLWLSHLYELPAAGGAARELAPGFDLSPALGRQIWPGPAPPTWTPDGTRLLFLAPDRSCDHLFELERAEGTTRTLIGGDARVISGLSVTSSGMAFIMRTPASSGEIHVAELDGSGVRQLTTLFSEALPDVELFVPESRTFAAPDGTDRDAWLLRGGGDGAPLLLDVHGGPHAVWSPAFEGVDLQHQLLAAEGWNVLLPNPLGSDGYGSSFWLDLVGRWGVADEGEFHAAVDALIAEGVADPDRLAVGGYSYGGFMTCWLTARSDRFRAAVAGGLTCNMTSIAGSSDFGALIVTAATGADPWYEHVETLFERSPLAHVDRVTTPTLIVQGGGEERTTVDQAEQWFAALRAKGTPAQLVVYPGGSHVFIDTGRPSHRLDYYRRYVDWLQRHVVGA